MRTAIQSEHDEQVTLMKWWALAHQRFGIPEQLLFAIPNGGVRNIVTASRLKAEGVRAGIPDLFLAVPSHGMHGLFVEVKRVRGGHVSDAQSVAIHELKSQGYDAVVCYGWEEAKAVIYGYLCH